MKKMDLIKLFEVYEFAKQAHGKQKRETGEDYITHPISVAKIARSYRADEPTVYGCLTHDVLEDTPISLIELENKFGAEISFLVDGVTNLDTFEKTFNKTKEYAQKDKRVILIKLADRIHNTLDITPRLIKRYSISNLKYIELGKDLGYFEIARDLEKLTKNLEVLK